MNQADYFCCPQCKGELVNSTKGLFCLRCNINYPINQEIPILVDMKHLPKHLQLQIEYFKNEKAINNIDYRFEPWQKSYLSRFSDNFGEVKDSVIIDCGSGSGYMAIELAKMGANVIACDLTLKGLVRIKKIAKSKGLGDKILLACCSAEKLPFKKAVADYFISNAVLEHIPKEKEAIEEINRVCKDNAGLMVAVPLKYQFLNPLFILINLIHDRRIGHLRRYDDISLGRKFFGWKSVKVYYTGHFLKVFKVMVNFIADVFNKETVERFDKKKENNKWGASNVVYFAKRQN